MSGIENLRAESAHEPAFAREMGEGDIPEAPVHALDSAEALAVHRKVLDWYYDAAERMYDNMLEQQLDYDFYDHIQWSTQDAAVLAARHQAPLTYNKIKMALDWIIGTERRTRIDGVVHPRSQDDVEIAPVKSALLKYLSDTNRVPWERSRAFRDQAIVGIGWTEETVRGDKTGEPVLVKHVPWNQMLWDPFSKADDLEDCRYVIRHKYLDLEYAMAMWPDRTDVVQRSARDHFSTDGYPDGETDLPQLWRRYDSRGHEIDVRHGGRHNLGQRGARLRVHAYECWFRRPVPVKKLWGGEFSGDVFDETDQKHVAAKEAIDAASAIDSNTIYSLSDAVTEEIWCAIFTDVGLLKLTKSPFNHGQFPFTPYWCYRRNRDNLPYGVVRGVRDAQEDLNKRFSKLLWALSTNQLHYEEGAIDVDRLEEVKRELAKPNGVIPYKDGGLGRSRVDRNLDVSEAQLKLLELDAAHIHDGSGVNRELQGMDTNAVSGRAIMAKQQEGAVTTAELFDQYRLGIQLSGEKQLSLMEQFMTEEQQFRIVGEKKDIDWTTINHPVWNPELGDWEFQNDITKGHADFIVDQQDFRESMRQAYAEQFFDMLGKLDPNVSIQLLDLAIDMTDMPNKEEVVRRIRKINGADAGEPGEQDPEVLAAQQAQAQQESDLQMRERLAKVGLDEAKANELMAKVKSFGLKDKEQALKLAELIETFFPLAPAADRLLSTEHPPAIKPPYINAAEEAMHA